MKKKRIFIVFLLICCLLVLPSCTESKYQSADFLGKTSVEIEMAFGAFDCVGKQADEDGLYRNTSCGYILSPARKGFLGTDPETIFFISFDENGIAFECYEGVRPGG